MTHVLAEAARRVSGEPAPPVPVLQRMLHQALLAQLVSTHLVDAPVATVLGEKPSAAPIARYQAVHGDPVTNLFHQALDLAPLDRFVVTRLDGAHTVGDVEAELAASVAAGALAPTDTGRPEGEGLERKSVPEILHHSLSLLLASCYILG